jgi:hypothetical protein
MLRRVDPGLDVVRRVWERLGCAFGGSAVWHRGFTWRPLGITQRVWCEPELDPPGPPAWRVQVRSDFVRGFTGSPAQLAALSLEMPLSALAAVVRSNENASRLQLVSTLHVGPDDVDGPAELVAFAAQLQAVEVRAFVRASSLRGAGAEADAAEEECGLEPTATDLADRLAARPACSPWAGAEMGECFAVLAATPGVRASATARGLSASVACPSGRGHRAQLELETVDDSPGLGGGLSVVVSVPGRGGVHEALRLNEFEAGPGCRTDLLGGWSAREGVLQHRAFFPDAVHAKGLAARVAGAAVRRVQRVCPVQDGSVH